MENKNTKTVIVTIHGQESTGENLKELSLQLSRETFSEECECGFVNIRYPRLLTVINSLPWVRTMTAKYVAARLETIKYKYSGHNVVVICHSNGTRATAIAIKKAYYTKKRYPRFNIDHLVLLGSPIERGFDWSKYPFVNVVNFISENDMVILFARLYGMGRAGRYGFKKRSFNLRQIKVRWGHSGFLKQYEKIRDVVRQMVETKS